MINQKMKKLLLTIKVIIQIAYFFRVLKKFQEVVEGWAVLY